MIQMGAGTDEIDIAWSQTPAQMINALLATVKTDALIADYVNSHFGTKVTVKRIAELRALRKAPRCTDHGAPIAEGNHQFKMRAARSSEKFLAALRRHHPEIAA